MTVTRNVNAFLSKFVFCVTMLMPLIPCNALAADSTSRPWAILHGKDLWGVFQQCSRNAPEPTSVWKLSERQVRDIDQQLIGISGSTLFDTLRPLVPDYHRQYAGFSIGHKKFAYIHATNFSILESAYRRVFATICDGGGRASWGIVYSFETHSFQDFEANGPPLMGRGGFPFDTR